MLRYLLLQRENDKIGIYPGVSKYSLCITPSPYKKYFCPVILNGSFFRKLLTFNNFFETQHLTCLGVTITQNETSRVTITQNEPWG